MCIRDSSRLLVDERLKIFQDNIEVLDRRFFAKLREEHPRPVSYTHLRAHETVLDLVCRLLLEKKKERRYYPFMSTQ